MMTSTHWLLLTRIIHHTHLVAGPLPLLYDLEQEGYVFSEKRDSILGGKRWYATTEGRKALTEWLATKPNWQR